MNSSINITRGAKRYELIKHPRNVMVVVTDKRAPQSSAINNVTSLFFYQADVVSANDYSPFGAPLVGRSYTAPNSDYRSHFNGKEMDNEVKGAGNSQDFGARIYDNRLGRWLACDPLANKYPNVSPFVYSVNTPIGAYDPDGKRVYFVAGAGNDKDKWGYTQRFANALNDRGIHDFVQINATKGKIGDILFTDTYKNFSEIKGTTMKVTSDMIKEATNAIVADLAAHPLKEGEQLNLAGYSYGSVLQAHVSIALADKGIKVDNLSLVGSPISDNSELMGTLKKYESEGKIGKVSRYDIEGDNLSNPSSELQYMSGGLDAITKGNNAPHFDLARPGAEADKKIEEVANKMKSDGVK